MSLMTARFTADDSISTGIGRCKNEHNGPAGAIPDCRTVDLIVRTDNRKSQRSIASPLDYEKLGLISTLLTNKHSSRQSTFRTTARLNRFVQLNQLKLSSGSGLIVAIETSTPSASLALALGESILHFRPLGTAEPTAKTIATALESLLQLADTHQQPISLVAVTAGPGSFTGLRIGVTMAKTLAYALSCPIAAVDTLATMVKQAFEEQPNVRTVHAALNAYRGQLFACSWDRDQWQQALSTGELGANTVAIDLVDWCAARATDRCDGSLAVIEPALANKVNQPYAMHLLPTAIQVAQLGGHLASLGRTFDAMQLLPNYLRPSAAEEKWNAPDEYFRGNLRAARLPEALLTSKEDRCQFGRRRDFEVPINALQVISHRVFSDTELGRDELSRDSF